MPYTKKLIGNINPEAEKLEIKVGKSHFSDLELLVKDYGWVGKGFKVILNKPAVRDSLRHGGVSDLLIGNGNVQGLEVFDEPDRNVLVHLLAKQHGRSLPIFYAAQKGELDTYDNVSIGVIKGVLIGGAVGAMLDGMHLTGPIPEMIARLGPGALESSGISHEVEKGKASKGTDKNLAEKVVQAFKETPKDVVGIVKRVPGGVYDGVNLYGWIDKLRGIRRQNGDSTNTETWSTAQESGPYRGVLGLLFLKPMQGYVPTPLYNALESLGVFWVNTGNNVQGVLAVYNSLKENSKTKMEALKKTVSDPFQLANILVCSVWYGGELALRSQGIRMEEYWGNLGAGLESAALSCDTAVAAQVAKGISYVQLIVPAKFSVTDRNLRKLGNRYGSDYFIRASR